MNQINWEVRDDLDYLCGWFHNEFDALTFKFAQARPERYRLVRVNKTVKENE